MTLARIALGEFASAFCCRPPFDHLFPRIRWRSESHLGQQKQPAVPTAYLKNPPIQAVMEVV